MSWIQQTEPPNKKAKRGPRTSKACDYCRDKKLKCDGGFPCGRCGRLSIQCSYNYIEKKRAPRSFKRSLEGVTHSTVESPYEIDHNHNPATVNARLDRIESLLSSLITHLEHNSIPSNIKYSNKPNTSDEIVRRSAEQISPDEQNYNGQYFGSHCSFSIFSPKGLTYITNRSKDTKAMDKIVKMLKEVHYVLYQQYRKRVEPASPNEVIKLPERGLCEDLVESFVNSRIYQNGIIDGMEIKERLNVYFENEQSVHKRELKQSDHAILHTVLALGALGKLENNYILNSGTKLSLKPNEVEFYKQVEDKHIISALYYFHRLTVFSDGINGIRSISLLILYFESSLIPDMEYLLISSIIRFCQSVGLHRIESLMGISAKDALLRQRIWLNCYVFDKDLCLKSGKPLIINDQDVSSLNIDERFLFDIESKIVSKLGISHKTLDFSNNQSHFKEFLKNLSILPFGITRFFEILNLKAARISSQVYFNLFSATALDGKSKKDVMAIVQSLNDSYYSLKESIPKFIRPGYRISIPSYHDNSNIDKILVYSNVVKFQLSYHLNVMNINKIGLNKNWNDSQVSSNLCLESAREIIRISQDIKLNDSHLYFCSLFIILSANVTLLSNILENPRDFNTIKSDLILMSKTSDLKRLKYIEFQYDPINTMKFLSITFTIKNFIKIGVEFYNQQRNKFNRDIFDSFEVLNNEKDLKILEVELEKCLKLIQDKYSFANFITSTTSSSASAALINNCTNLVDQQTRSGLDSDSNDRSEVEHQSQILSNMQGSIQKNSCGSDVDPTPTVNVVLNENFGFTNIEELVLNSELLDMSYFSQPIFNIPNFMMDETP